MKKLLAAIDRWQRRTPPAAVAWATVRKFGEDSANLQVVSLGWYGFTAIFPTLLVVVTIFGFIGAGSLGSSLLSTLHQFPVIGQDFNPEGASKLHGSTVGLIVGLLGLIYGAQGVTNTAQGAMASFWDIPKTEQTGFLPRIGRSWLALILIGLTFVINAVASAFATGAGRSIGISILVIAGMIVLNVISYLAVFRTLTAKQIATRPLAPGAVAAGVAFTLLITVGTGLLTHQLKNTSATYGAFGSVIGLVTFLLLLAKLSMYSAELNAVLANHLYPRALPTTELTDADRRVMAREAGEQQERPEENIGVEFEEEAHAGEAGEGSRKGSKEVRGRA
ncbi:MAG TPA: YhjD/YihY/BrkB family envelope integrity protein [Acidimicrobiales bacterium]|nr:YhjD/YihY/BrkB family envelope integrity protein [Acidimicrobiales bacterium]